MIRMTFEKDREHKVVCRSTDEHVRFMMNQEIFENREYRFGKNSFLFDGYSIWFKDEGVRLRGLEDFSLSFSLAPIGYSEQGDGLFSFFDLKEKKGLFVLVKKFGKVLVGFGNGKNVWYFESINAGLLKLTWNMLTVVFRKEEGWCDLYINGVLSNRKQFPRHMAIAWPETYAYLGKYVNQEDYNEEKKTGIYYGFLREMMIYYKCLTDEDVRNLHALDPVTAVEENTNLDRSIFKNDVHRPQYHLIAPGKWMNEPHAPVYFDGYYHIFYQANPHAPIFDNLQWGHMVSRDMVHWEDMPLALETENNQLDPDGCWSGSALIDRQGQPRIFYTAGNNNKFPNQSIAMAEAIIEPDKKLEKWKKYPLPVVTQSLGWLGEFRDSFVWLEDDTYYMLVGTGDAHNGGGNAALFSSIDMVNWQSHGFILDYEYEKNMELGHVWELPVLLPLRDETGEIVCHILLLCACQIEHEVVEVYGFLGNWDSGNKKFRSFQDRAILLDLGHGTFTGPSGFVTPDKRSVVFTIAQGKRNGYDEFHAGWAHNGGLPVELFIKKKKLHIRPIREIYQLKEKCLLELNDISLDEANQQLQYISGNRLWMRVTVDAESISVETSCGDQKKVIYYDKASGRLGVLDESGKQIGKYRGEIDRVDIEQELVTMEYFLDHSMIEVYLNEMKSITLRNYGEGSERTLKLGGKAHTLKKLEVWEMNTAYDTKN